MHEHHFEPSCAGRLRKHGASPQFEMRESWTTPCGRCEHHRRNYQSLSMSNQICSGGWASVVRNLVYVAARINPTFLSASTKDRNISVHCRSHKIQSASFKSVIELRSYCETSPEACPCNRQARMPHSYAAGTAGPGPVTATTTRLPLLCVAAALSSESSLRLGFEAVAGPVRPAFVDDALLSSFIHARTSIRNLRLNRACDGRTSSVVPPGAQGR